MLGKHPRHGPFLKAVSPAAPMRQNLVQLCTEWLRVHRVARTSLLWSLILAVPNAHRLSHPLQWCGRTGAKQLTDFCSCPQTSNHFWVSTTSITAANNKAWRRHRHHREVCGSRIPSSLQPTTVLQQIHALLHGGTEQLTAPTSTAQQPALGLWQHLHTRRCKTRCLKGFNLGRTWMFSLRILSSSFGPGRQAPFPQAAVPSAFSLGWSK